MSKYAKEIINYLINNKLFKPRNIDLYMKESILQNATQRDITYLRYFSRWLVARHTELTLINRISGHVTLLRSTQVQIKQMSNYHIKLWPSRLQLNIRWISFKCIYNIELWINNIANLIFLAFIVMNYFWKCYTYLHDSYFITFNSF